MPENKEEGYVGHARKVQCLLNFPLIWRKHLNTFSCFKVTLLLGVMFLVIYNNYLWDCGPKPWAWLTQDQESVVKNKIASDSPGLAKASAASLSSLENSNHRVLHLYSVTWIFIMTLLHSECGRAKKWNNPKCQFTESLKSLYSGKATYDTLLRWLNFWSVHETVFVSSEKNIGLIFAEHWLWWVPGLRQGGWQMWNMRRGQYWLQGRVWRFQTHANKSWLPQNSRNSWRGY